MGQKFRQDKIGALSHNSGTITMAASSSNPAYLSIGGQQYRITNNLTLSVGTATAATRYQIYATVSGGVVSLQKSIAENSVGPGAASWKLIGCFFTSTANTFGFFLNIEGMPQTARTLYSPTVSGLNTVTTEVYWQIVGGHVQLTGRITGTSEGTDYYFTLPSGMTLQGATTNNRFSFGAIVTSSQGNGDYLNSATEMMTGFYNGSNTDRVYLATKLTTGNMTVQSGTAAHAGAGSARTLHLNGLLVPIAGGLSTPIKDL